MSRFAPVLAVSWSLLVPLTAAAQSIPVPDQTLVGANETGRLGVGAVIGNTMTGVGGKMWMSPTSALQLAVGTGPLGNTLNAQFDALFGIGRWDSRDRSYFVLFYTGVGGRIGTFFDDPATLKYEVGGRIPVGGSVLIPNAPIELYVEIAPLLSMRVDKADKQHIVFYADGAIGLRYFF